MFSRLTASLAATALLAGHAIAKTDIGGCMSTQTVAYGGASLIWYVPDTGEICEFLDCGGGRAPPKTTVPGCPSYEGTATYSPSYLPGFGVTATSTTSSISVVATTESSSSSGDASSSAQTSPVTTFTGTVTSSASTSAQTQTQTETQTGSHSDTASSSAAGSTSSSSVSTGGAAFPTGSVKGPIGVMAGMAIGAAFL